LQQGFKKKWIHYRNFFKCKTIEGQERVL